MRNIKNTIVNSASGEVEIIGDNEFVSLPPFVVNDLNPVLAFESETIDWGTAMLRIPQIHSEFKLTGKGVKVAVIDTGVNKDHPDIKGAVIETHNTTSEGYSATNGHGSGTCGIIAARKNNRGILSVAPDCQIIAIKALHESGSGSMVDIVEAINLAINRGAHVINLSLGGSSTIPSLEQAVNLAASRGIYVICAAGNSGTDNSVGYPAKYPKALAVGAMNKQRKTSAFSSRGLEVDIAGPGERILTCWKNNSYATVSGTSFATPYLSGCYALFVQAGIKPTLEILKDLSVDIDDPGHDAKSGYGFIDPYAIIKKYKKKTTAHSPEDEQPDVERPNVEQPGVEQPSQEPTPPIAPPMTHIPCAAPPAFISPISIGEKEVTISWQSSDTAFNYTLEYKQEDSTGEWISEIARQPNFTIIGLKPSTPYFVRVRSNCSNGISPYLGAQFTTKSPCPECPPAAIVSLGSLSQAVDLINEFLIANHDV